ncbi:MULTISPECIES: DUF4864 domain-containing protein [unclassified Minwuia]|uniref:DUF4864 domain-containing protein n=1 Tax=unclassified Minwuia TaxID=2618799 RepID=UPI002478875A|nr:MULTISPECIES: DUF4864 domain-containing protein [unclassified Minwuia]
MRALALSIVMLLATVLPMQAHADADAESIRDVINQQIEAFRADDGERAFSFAAPVIRSKFGTADNFMTMVRTGYPDVYRPRAVEFRELKRDGERLVQEVWFLGTGGDSTIGTYIMERQEDGVWKIAGVYMRRAPSLGA